PSNQIRGLSSTDNAIDWPTVPATKPGIAEPMDPSGTGPRSLESHELTIAMPCSVCPQWSRTSDPRTSGAQETTSGVRGSPADDTTRKGRSSLMPSFFIARYTVGDPVRFVTSKRFSTSAVSSVEKPLVNMMLAWPSASGPTIAKYKP